MAENGTKAITFPATSAAGEAKLKRLVETIADYMGVKITIETVIVMQAKYPGDRLDIESIFKRLAGSKTGLRTVASEATKIPTPADESAAEKGE